VGTVPKKYGIVYATLGPRGEYKPRRPGIVIGEVISTPSRIKVVVCSTSFGLPLQPNEILLPSGPPWPHPLTGLAKPTVAIWDWLEEIAVDEIEAFGGEIPPIIAVEILKRIKQRWGATDPNLLPRGSHVRRPS
jgi:hypothetical protein